MRKVFHWLACHLVAVVFAVFLAIAIIFRGPLFGIVEEIAEPENTESMTSGGSFESESTDLTPVEAVLSPPAKSPTDEEPMVNLQPVNQPDANPDPLPPAISNPGETDQMPSTVAIEEALSASQVVDTEPVPDSAGDLKADLLQQARRAYWNDQLNKARTLYQAYIDMDPDDPDGYGELGNLLGTAGELDKAAEMYMKAAELLTQQGRLEEAEQLARVLDSISVIQKAKN